MRALHGKMLLQDSRAEAVGSPMPMRSGQVLRRKPRQARQDVCVQKDNLIASSVIVRDWQTGTGM
jgi:hypothetical protein